MRTQKCSILMLMKTSNKYQRPRTSSKITKKSSTILCPEITTRKIQTPHPTPGKEILAQCL